MADQAPEIKIKITGEDTGVAAAIKELSNQLSGLKQKTKEVEGATLDLKAAFQTLIASEVVLKVVEFGKEVYNTTLNIERMSERTGLSAGLLSTFGKAAESSGASTEQVNVALSKLALNITKFQQGSTGAAAAFKALNISQADFKNLSPDEKVRLVTDRLGGMTSGLQKAAIAQQLLGRGGSALIPTLDQLAGDGFDKVTEAAKRTGQYVSDQMAQDAKNVAIAFAELEGAGKGIATQFEAGLIPALTDVAESFSKSIEGDSADSFKKLGEDAGLVVKGIVVFFENGATLIAALWLSLADTIEGIFDEIKVAASSTLDVVIATAEGRYLDAADAIGKGFSKAFDTAADHGEVLANTWTTAISVIKAQADSLFKVDDGKFKPPKPEGGGGGGGVPDDKAEKARLSLREAEIQEQLALTKASNAAEENANQIAYNEGLESLADFYRKKLALAESDNDAQIDALTRQRAAIAAAPTDGTDAAALAKRQKIEKLDNDISIARIAGSQKLATINEQQFQAEEAHRKTLLGYQAQILAAQGLTYQAAVAQIEGEAAAIERSLVQAGLSPEQVSTLVGQLQQLKLSAAAFNEDKKQGEIALKSIADQKSSIDLDVRTGQLSQIQGEIQLANLERARLPELEAIAAAMHAAAISPEQKQAADDFDQKIKQIAADTNFMGQEFGKFKTQIEQGGISELSNFLGNTINQVHGVGDAFRQLASSAVASLQKIAAQLIAEIVIRKLIQAITHQDEGTSKIATSAAAGLAQAAPLIAASAAMSTAGGVVIAAGIGLGVSAAALQVAATTLLIANSAGGAGGFAEGGLVPGQGSGDTVPAMLTPGEVVIRRAAVQAVGLDTLMAINRGFRIPSIAGVGVQRFAEGGLVQGLDRSDRMDVQLGISLDEGLVLKHLASKPAGRLILHHLTDNPKAASRAIQRGG